MWELARSDALCCTAVFKKLDESRTVKTDRVKWSDFRSDSDNSNLAEAAKIVDGVEDCPAVAVGELQSTRPKFTQRRVFTWQIAHDDGIPVETPVIEQ
jgi:hypothetical protein